MNSSPPTLAIMSLSLQLFLSASAAFSAARLRRSGRRYRSSVSGRDVSENDRQREGLFPVQSFKLFFEKAPVVQTGEAVMIAQVIDAGLVLPAFRVIGEGDDRAGEFPVPELGVRGVGHI